MPAAALSNVRAFAVWKHSSIYAGEDLECTITFRNVASNSDLSKEHGDITGPQNGDSRRSPRIGGMANSRRASTVQTRPEHARALSTSSAKGFAGRGHRPTLSLNVVSAPTRPGIQPPSAGPAARGHGRSLSIISLNSEVGDDKRLHMTVPVGRRGGRAHTRSASLQFLPSPTSPADAPLRGPSSRQPSPLSGTAMLPATTPVHGESLSVRPRRLRPERAFTDRTPKVPGPNGSLAHEALDSEFQFPPKPPSTSPSSRPDRPRPLRASSSIHSNPGRGVSPRPADNWAGALYNLNPINRVMSEASTTNDTPRTSGELYSASNHSGETLVSELPQTSQAESRFWNTPAHSRQPTQTRIHETPKQAKPETLMMASVQTQGQFVLDGSLVNTAPFDEVKRKGVQSGGGVVGMERSKRSSGIFGALGWGSLGESLGGLLGTDEMSSLAQMKASAGSKTIPLLSTPQSLLFVDLTLAPGESRSYSYTFGLPRGLPPTHRGRAIKIDYHLLLTVQRPDGQAVQRVQIPFRVLGSYNGRGEILGHDLMSPYILLKDTARTEHVVSDAVASKLTPVPGESVSTSVSAGDLEDFLRYTARLLEQSSGPSGALLSPALPPALPSPTASRHGSVVEQLPLKIKEVVDLAILRSNQLTSPSPQQQSGGQSSNRFNIARSGQPVAVLNLLRPAFRLGETVTGVIDLTAPAAASGLPAHVPTYFVSVELESAECIDPSLALRSSHSINRVTRKVHAASSSCTAFTRQMSFGLPIPPNASPTFETTGVSLTWRLRIEFTTQRQSSQAAVDPELGGLWDVVARDERGTTLMAKERLLAETFEIAVPLKVYGTPSIDLVTEDGEALVV